nr:uncharacterized protein CI109_006146 [Kwoniella shandongensis]KAA5525573.1 hypothetical protein CI109_006146 [Kwoniella shandongensis]
MVVAKIHAEDPELTVLAINPGLVDTDMGNDAAQYIGLTETPLKLANTLPQMV